MEDVRSLELLMASYHEGMLSEERQIREAKSRLAYNVKKFQETLRLYEETILRGRLE